MNPNVKVGDFVSVAGSRKKYRVLGTRTITRIARTPMGVFFSNVTTAILIRRFWIKRWYVIKHDNVEARSCAN